MKTYCCVPQCTNNGGHMFPSISNKILRQKWIEAVRRDKWEPTKWSVVCSAHFMDTDFKTQTAIGTPIILNRLKPDIVPSLFSWNKDSINQPKKLKRYRNTKPDVKYGEEIGDVKISDSTMEMQTDPVDPPLIVNVAETTRKYHRKITKVEQ